MSNVIRNGKIVYQRGWWVAYDSFKQDEYFAHSRDPEKAKLQVTLHYKGIYKDYPIYMGYKEYGNEILYSVERFVEPAEIYRLRTEMRGVKNDEPRSTEPERPRIEIIS